ncbi:O-antigen ligase family protein [Vibrio cholerae]|nr:O-antigen ligase family protein [Vibrio cholerae]
MTTLIIICYAFFRPNVNKRDWIILSGIILVLSSSIFSALPNDEYTKVNDIARLIFLLQCVFFVGVVYKYINIKILLAIIFFSSLFIAVIYNLNFLVPSGSGELSYLIVAMQILIGFGVAMGFIFHGDNRYRYISIPVALFMGYSILTLSSRSAIIAIFLLLIMVSVMKNIRAVISVFFIIIFSLYLYSDLILLFLSENVLNEYLVYKMQSLLSGDLNDPRFETYRVSVGLILDNPFGLGLNNYLKYIGYYPHNIFLEIALNSGLFFSLLFFIYVVYSGVILYVNRVNIGSFFIFPLYYAFITMLISWMTSNDLSSSYGIFLLLSIFLVSIKDSLVKFDNNGDKNKD